MNQVLKNGGYMICASPRGGSTLLCDLLEQTMVAGIPKSYFRPASIKGFSKQWGLSEASDSWGKDYIDATRKNSSNGTVHSCCRIMWSDFELFINQLRNISVQSVKDRKLIADVLGIDRFIFLYREDKVAQAVSLAIADQTGLWHLNSDGSERQRTKDHSDPVYTYDQIYKELRMLEEEAVGWNNWFKSNSIQPLRVSYETLSLNPTGVLAEVMEYIGLKPVDVKVGTKKMATDLNKVWIEQFRQEAGLSH